MTPPRSRATGSFRYRCNACLLRWFALFTEARDSCCPFCGSPRIVGNKCSEKPANPVDSAVQVGPATVGTSGPVATGRNLR